MMEPYGYDTLPFSVFIINTNNGKIIYANSLAEKTGFKKGAEIFAMVEEKTTFLREIKKASSHSKITVAINEKDYLAVIDTVRIEEHGESVVLVVVSNIKAYSTMDEDEMISRVFESYCKNNKNPLYDFLQITAKGIGAFCASLYEKKRGRYSICDEWRARKNICVPLLSGDFDDFQELEIKRLRIMKRASEVIAVAYQKEHGTQGVVMYFFDSTTDEQMEATLKKLTGIYTLMSQDDVKKDDARTLKYSLERIEQGIGVWDADTELLLFENKAFREKFGSGSAKLLISRLPELKTKQSIQYTDNTGRSFSISNTKSRIGGRRLVVTAIAEITRYKQAENELEMLAKKDALTGLNNRRAGLEILETAYSRCKRERKPLIVCFADIDGLKRVNDTYGHGVGDNMIRTVASLLKKHINGSGDVCRLGGDEFLLILPYYNKARALELSSRIEQAIERTFTKKLQNISMSFGFKEAEYNTKETIFALISKADSDMYKKKKSRL